MPKRKRAKTRTEPIETAETTAAEDGGDEPVWLQTNLACQNTYALLIGLKQLTETFDEARDVPMKRLAFWNPAATETMRTLVATGIATQLDKIYTRGYWADYEPDFDFHRAIERMVAVLIQPDKTVAHFANTVNNIYHFRGE